MSLSNEIGRRRTFAIISHPDAGKTTLTEKFLLYGGAVQLAGSVTARKSQRATASDWMELERKRGISISSTVLQFEYGGFCINLLDTPGHQDFSEDTYRVLTAVDAAVMVIDAGKGIESQTRKLFEICRRRGVPIFTFMNKLDRPTRDPLELLDELESVLGMHAYPVNWPLGTGFGFTGVIERFTRQVHLFDAATQGQHKPGLGKSGLGRATATVAALADDRVRAAVGDVAHETTLEELAMLDSAGAAFDPAAVLRGELTPVFFGSASNNFGVQLLLDGFLKYSSAPRPRAVRGALLDPAARPFSGFIFKMQANMDPRHRDCLAFVRVCSGRFERDMTVTHHRSGKKVRLSNSHKLFGRERETVDEAFAGDIIGVIGQPEFRVGDTLTEDPAIVFHALPRFAPEHFAYLHSTGAAQQKRFRAGLAQLLQEGVIQVLEVDNAAQKLPLLGAVGPLQFDVVQYRLQSEYGAESRLVAAPWACMRWIDPRVSAETLRSATLLGGSTFATDSDDRRVVLFPSDWELNYFAGQHAHIPLADVPFTDDGHESLVHDAGDQSEPTACQPVE